MWILVSLAKFVQGVSTLDELRTKVSIGDFKEEGNTVETASHTTTVLTEGALIPDSTDPPNLAANVQADLDTSETSDHGEEDGEAWTLVAPGKTARRTPKRVTSSSNLQGHMVYAPGNVREIETMHTAANSEHERDGNPIIPSV
ncbi:unnamed protein product [Amaranthus hypochondriacus]